MAAASSMWYGGFLFRLLPTQGRGWEIGDRVCGNLKTTAAWWRSGGGYLACSGLRRPVLLGSGWLAWDIVGDDGAREVGYMSASSWVVVTWCGGFVWSRV